MRCERCDREIVNWQLKTVFRDGVSLILCRVCREETRKKDEDEERP